MGSRHSFPYGFDEHEFDDYINATPPPMATTDRETFDQVYEEQLMKIDLG